MGRDKIKVAWGKANSRGDLCSITSRERPHQGPPIAPANGPSERTEDHSAKAERADPPSVRSKLAAAEPARSRTSNLLIRSQTRYPLRHWPCKGRVAQTDSRRVSRHKARAGLGDLHSFIYPK